MISPIKQVAAVCPNCGSQTMLFDDDERCMLCGRARNPTLPIPGVDRIIRKHHSSAHHKKPKGRPTLEHHINTAPFIKMSKLPQIYVPGLAWREHATARAKPRSTS